MSEKPLYSYPYRGKPRFFVEGLLNDDSTTSSNIHIMTKNCELVQFHNHPFKELSSPPASPSALYTPSPLTSPSSCYSSVSVDRLIHTDLKMPSTEVEIVTQKILKQCQYLICYICYEVIFRLKTMNKKSINAAMYEYYHGVEEKPHIIHHAWYFSKGYGKFAAAMERCDVDGYQRLTSEVTQERDHLFIVNEIRIENEPKVITMAMLKKKTINSDQILSAWAIQSYAETALKNCKKATALGQQFIQSDGNLPSGWSRQDYFSKVLDLMYDKISNDTKGKKVIDGEQREEIKSKERPPHWVFNGFMAFVLYGPLASDELKSNIMSGGADDDDKSKIQGRKTARIEGMDLVNQDNRKKSFNQMVKLENNCDGTTKLSEKNSIAHAMLLERQKENGILATATILNGKINQLNALVSIHASNVQRELGGFTMSKIQSERMSKNEDKIDKLNDEIESMQSQLKEGGDSDNQSQFGDSSGMGTYHLKNIHTDNDATIYATPLNGGQTTTAATIYKSVTVDNNFIDTLFLKPSNGESPPSNGESPDSIPNILNIAGTATFLPDLEEHL